MDPRKAPPRPPLQSGDRIELEEMPDDPCPVLVGARGTVVAVVDRTSIGPPRAWQVEVKWDSGRTLSLLIPPDKVKKLTT